MDQPASKGVKNRARAKRAVRAAPLLDAGVQPLVVAAATAPSISIWMDDPHDGIEIARPVPILTKGSLICKIAGTSVRAAVYAPGTEGFRYWTAAEAMRRCAAFWLARSPALTWYKLKTLPVTLDAGLDFNAFYDRRGLTFFHGAAYGKSVFSSESPDIVCHEMGHAILDGFKPELWNVASHEVAAFHEAFGDISAILVGLQLPEVRMRVLEETQGKFNRSSRLSRIAEQLSAAIRVTSPDSVEKDCLRNAANRFMYQSPLELKASGPASTLSAAPHSFSRVFTGAVLDAMAGMLTTIAVNPNAPSEGELHLVSEHTGDIVMSALRNASVVSNFFAQIAAAMVSSASMLNPLYPRVLKAAFIKRDILSLQSATSVESLVAAANVFGGAIASQYESAYIALEGAEFGLGGRSLLCETPSQPRRIAASAAATKGGAVAAAGSEVAARGFVEDLFKRGKVCCDGVASNNTRIDPVRGLKTHRLAAGDGQVVLQRVLCDCGLFDH